MKNIFLYVGIVVFIGLVYFIFTMSSEPDQVQEDVIEYTDEIGGENADMPTDTVSGMRAEGNAVITTAQRPANTVKVAQVFLAQSGYVVIHEDVEGNAGSIIGTSVLLNAGESNNVVVPLTRATKDGEQLWSMLHFERNNNTSFNASVDFAVESTIGGPLSGWFEISSTAEENIEVTL